MATSSEMRRHCGPYRDSALMSPEGWLSHKKFERKFVMVGGGAWPGRRCKGKSLAATSLEESGESGHAGRGRCWKLFGREVGRGGERKGKTMTLCTVVPRTDRLKKRACNS